MVELRSWRCFVINLDRSPLRMQSISLQLDNIGIAFERFAAIDGEAIGIETSCTFNRRCYERRHGKQPAAGEIGCFLSHIGVMRQFLESKAKYALILEDDAIISPEIIDVLRGLEELSGEWDTVLLYGNHAGLPQPLLSLGRGHLLVGFLGRQTGAVAYVVNRKAAATYIRELLPMSLPFDCDFDRVWDLGIKFRGVLPQPVATGKHLSDIGRTGKKFPWYRRFATYTARITNEMLRLHHYLVCEPIWLLSLRFRYQRRIGVSLLHTVVIGKFQRSSGRERFG